MSFCPRCNGPMEWVGTISQGKLKCLRCESEEKKRKWKEHLERLREEAQEAYRGADAD